MFGKKREDSMYLLRNKSKVVETEKGSVLTSKNDQKQGYVSSNRPLYIFFKENNCRTSELKPKMRDLSETC